VELIENVACTVCGCVCDDLRITVDSGRITKAEGPCCSAEPWFLGQDRRQQDVLERSETDACLPVGSEGVSRFSAAALGHLRGIPTIALDYPTVESVPPPTVRFTTAVYGVHRPGTAYRMDEIPIPLRGFLPTDYPSDGDVLDMLLEPCTSDAALQRLARSKGAVSGPRGPSFEGVVGLVHFRVTRWSMRGGDVGLF
jgi:formylmethanofuran dehydrogenase subunit B